MDATTTRTTSWLTKRLSEDYPHITLSWGDTTCWNYQQASIILEPEASAPQILHEYGHALLNHNGYQRDIQLLNMERQAWTYAKNDLAPKYGITISEDDTEDALDTYRDWLHARSTCPSCRLNGVQTSENAYRCLSCKQAWRPNQATTCQLKRYKLN